MAAVPAPTAPPVKRKRCRPEIDEPNGEDVFTVHDIFSCEVRQEKGHAPMIWYLLSWLPPDDSTSWPNSWVSSEDMAEDLIEFFEQKHPVQAAAAKAEIMRRKGGRPPRPKPAVSSAVDGRPQRPKAAVSSVYIPAARVLVDSFPVLLEKHMVAPTFEQILVPPEREQEDTQSDSTVGHDAGVPAESLEPASASLGAVTQRVVRPSTAVGSAVAGQMMDFLRRNPSYAIQDKETWKKFKEEAIRRRAKYCSIDVLLTYAQSDPFQIAFCQSKKQQTYAPEDPKLKAWNRYQVWVDRMGKVFQGHCEMCERTLIGMEPSGWHAAHNVAWTKGGSHGLENRRVSCPACNMSTSTLNFDEQAEARRLKTSSSQAKLQDTQSAQLL